MPFVKGQSGNPAGRPLGARNKANLALEEALSAEGADLASRIIEHAKLANPAAMRLCMDRMMPKLTGRPVAVALPPASTPDYARAAVDVVIRELADGEITISEANGLLGLIERIVRLLSSKAVAAREAANNNAETIVPATAARSPVAPPTGPAVVNINANTGSTAHLPAGAAAKGEANRPRIDGGATERLMSSTSPLAHVAGARPGTTMPAMPPR